MKTDSKNVINTERDRMPPEVATEMLCEPKAKLSGRERRACMRARETVYPSTRPIVRPVKRQEDGTLVPLPYEYVDASEPVPRLQRKVREMNCKQLLTSLRRLRRYRSKSQHKYTKLQEQLPHAKSKHHANLIQKNMEFLDRLVSLSIDPKIDMVEDELKVRTA